VGLVLEVHLGQKDALELVDDVPRGDDTALGNNGLDELRQVPQEVEVGEDLLANSRDAGS